MPWIITTRAMGSPIPELDKKMQPLALAERDIHDVVAFLASLTSPQYRDLGDQEYARQLAISKVSRHRARFRPQANPTAASVLIPKGARGHNRVYALLRTSERYATRGNWQRRAIGDEPVERVPPDFRKDLSEEFGSRRVRSRYHCGTARQPHAIVRPRLQDRPQ